MAAPPADPDRFEEAIRAFRRRVPMTDAQFAALTEAERAYAFKVAGLTQARQVQEVFDAIDRAIEQGTTLDDFKAEVGQTLAEAWGGEDAPRTETVFRTNVMTAYNEGRTEIQDDPVVREARPYLRFDAVGDSRMCFPAGTMVVGMDGIGAPIETVRPGDMVLSCRGEYRRVIACLTSRQSVWIRVTLSDGRVLQATPEHPILTTSGWTQIRRVAAGDSVVLGEASGRGKLQNLWEGLRENDSHPLLLDGLQAGDLPQEFASPELQGMRGGIPAVRHHASRRDAESADLLFDRLRSAQDGVSSLRGGIPDEADLLAPRADGFLFERLQERRAPRGDTGFRSDAPVREVRAPGRASARTTREAEARVLLAGLSPPAGVRLSPLRKALQGRGWGQSLLLCRLLSQVQGRDRAGKGRQASTGGIRSALRTGGQDRAVGGGLPGRWPTGGGGGRPLLALGAEGAEAGPQEGPRAMPQGLRSPEAARSRYQTGSGGGQARAHRLWPFPSLPRLTIATTVTVVAVSWVETPRLPAYDLEVEIDKGFIAGGVVVHNSDICEALDGKVLPADDPFWRTHTPPLHHNCRSVLTPLDEDEAREEGISRGRPDTGDAEVGEGFGRRAVPDPDPDMDAFDPAIRSILRERLK